MKELISKIVGGENLTAEEAESAMKTIMSGNSNEVEISSFLTALRMKGEASEEIASFAKIMREFASRIEPQVDGTLVDVCGTGGDMLNTFNISTTSMFVVAGAGIPIAKHGNRALTSKSGSADVLEELGVNLNSDFDKIKESIEKVGIGFMFAPMHHLAMKHVMPVRKQLGFRTVFNILGPLTNPANAGAQLMGVFDPALTETLANVFKILGLERAVVAHGDPGLDELSTLGKTKVSELKDGEVNTYFIKPEEFGLSIAREEDIAGGTAKDNAEILKNILAGEDTGPRSDITLLNAAAGILVGGMADNLTEGMEVAKDSLESGKAQKKLEELVKFSK
ncbi:MAG: anthranilate phosphoribosyltransferase [Candidatus Altiarchaeales archaeon]|nr:anthranilate phosphoribosyltransferase [Candidatus Altiarchaeota archaeon]MBU4341669.1 anthranilate phosphoribosyltransferase [Candidatus Altiarchaeota archaeon]MBU4437261.1 anthranilate phosphoribosyltransferase [Candidatus Altiarchaeota archaeon]MCG2782581.1 anthranilate phosphoribosyltransferase [Candidatus Altiarchaeales archaeon]